MKQYFVYILKCADNSYYTGVTNNVAQRLKAHQNGKDSKSYTYKRRPVKLIFQQTFNDVNQAILFEKQLKGWSRKKKEALINGNWNKLKESAECQNQSHYKNYKEGKT